MAIDNKEMAMDSIIAKDIEMYQQLLQNLQLESRTSPNNR